MVLRESAGALLLSPFVLAELDYLVGKLLGTPAALRLLDEVAQGAYRLEPFTASDVQRARAVMAKHSPWQSALPMHRSWSSRSDTEPLICCRSTSATFAPCAAPLAGDFGSCRSTADLLAQSFEPFLRAGGLARFAAVEPPGSTNRWLASASRSRP